MLNMTPPFEKEDFDIEMKPPEKNSNLPSFKTSNFKRIKLENCLDYLICSEQDFDKVKHCKWYAKYEKVPYSEGTIAARCDKKAGVRGFLLKPIGVVTQEGMTFEEYVGMQVAIYTTVFDKRRV